MGSDYWSYGVDDNIRDLESFCRYCDAQHLTARLVSPDELFHPDTMTKPGR